MRISDWSSDVCSSDLWYAFEKSDAYQRFVLTKLVEATFKADAAPGTNDPVLFRTPEGREYWTSADWLVDSAIAKQALEKLESDLISGAILSGVFALAALVFAWFYFTRTGKGLGSNEYLRGAHFRSEEHTSELQSLMRISYAVFCLKKKQ